MPTASQVAGTMMALLFFMFQDAAKAGKATCDMELDIDTPLPKNVENLLQANAAPKMSAAESEMAQCVCRDRKKNGKCKKKSERRGCAAIKQKKDCHDFKKNKHGKPACRWNPRRTPRPTPEPTPAPNPPPSPSCLSKLGPKPTYKEHRDARCKAEHSKSRTDSWFLGIGTEKVKDHDCGRVCDWLPWCRAYEQMYISKMFNGKLQPETLSSCNMFVDEKIWAADAVVAAEKKKWTWNEEGESYPSDMEGNPSFFEFPIPCPQDLDLRRNKLTLINRCHVKSAYGKSVYGNGAFYEYKNVTTNNGNLVRSSCFQKEMGSAPW